MKTNPAFAGTYHFDEKADFASLFPRFLDRLPEGAAVVLYDDDHYAMGSALAEWLRGKGHQVTYVTPLPVVSSWTQMTDEQGFIQSSTRPDTALAA